MKRYRYQKTLPALLAILLVVTLFVGCSSPRPDPEEVISKAISAIEGVEIYHVERTATTVRNGEMTQSSVLADFVLPDSLHMIAEDEKGTTESIWLGEIEYTWDDSCNTWEVGALPESLRYPNLIADMAGILDSLVQVVPMRDEKVDGVDSYHFKAIIDMSAKGKEVKGSLDSSQPGYAQLAETLEMRDQWQLTSEFWVGKEDYQLRKFEQHQWLPSTENASLNTDGEVQQSITITYRFFDFNKPFPIGVPIEQ